ARFADQRERLAPVQREADAVDRVHAAGALDRKGDPEVLDLEYVGHALPGSTASRRASPTRLAESTVPRMARPGKIAFQGAVTSTDLASRIMPPQDGVGGCTPSPRKESPASTRMTSPTPSVAATSSGPRALGSRCRKIIRRRGAPSASAARMKFSSR